MSLLAIAILGILASIATEAITWLNAKLSGTVLKGKAAFILAIFVSLAAAFMKEVVSAGAPNLSHLGIYFSQVFAASQVFFVLIVEWLGLDVKTESPQI